MENNNKITILTKIYENKDILFGRFSDTLTHENKIDKWKEIADTLRALGIYNKGWKYLRDTTWQNWRKRTMEKKDNRLQTGSGGGKNFRYDDCDELVFKIIGKDSPVIDGLPVPESSGTNEADVSAPIASSSTANSSSGTNLTPLTPGPCKRKRTVSRLSLCETEIQDELTTLKIQKIKLDMEISKARLEIAKREQHKLDLEILKMERDLQISHPSTFTMPFYNVVPQGDVVVEADNVVVAQDLVDAQDDFVAAEDDFIVEQDLVVEQENSEQDAEDYGDILNRAIISIL